MRVVLTTESYLPYLSGVTVSVDALARGLRAIGHEVLVVAPRPARGAHVEPVGSPGPTPRYAWLPSYQPPAVVPPAYRMPLPIQWAGARREVRAFAPDVIHAHSPFVTGVLARRLARSTDAPLVFTHHTRFADYAHYLGPLAAPGSRLTDAYLRGFWRACAAIVAPSEDLAAMIRARIGPDRADRVHVIPTGVDVAGIRALTAVDPRPEPGLAVRRAGGRVARPARAREEPRHPVRRGSTGRSERSATPAPGGRRRRVRARRCAPGPRSPTWQVACTSPAASHGPTRWLGSRARTCSSSPRGPRPRGWSWRRH